MYTVGSTKFSPPPYMPLETIEPLLRVDESRFVMFPIKHNDVWDLYKKSMDSFWKAEDIDLSRDYSDWVTMSADEQHFIKMVLAFFAASDGIIIENLISKLLLSSLIHFLAQSVFFLMHGKFSMALNSFAFSSEHLMYVSINKLYVSECTFSMKFWNE